jgi:hypothetical protein
MKACLKVCRSTSARPKQKLPFRPSLRARLFDAQPLAHKPSTPIRDGISISYTDSGGSDPLVFCLHAIGVAPEILKTQVEGATRSTASSHWTFRTTAIQARIPGPPPLPATLRSSRNSSTSYIFQPLCCLATPSAEQLPSVTSASSPNASRPLCCAIVADSVLPVPSAISLLECSCNSSQQAGAVLSGFRGPSIARPGPLRIGVARLSESSLRRLTIKVILCEIATNAHHQSTRFPGNGCGHGCHGGLV